MKNKSVLKKLKRKFGQKYYFEFEVKFYIPKFPINIFVHGSFLNDNYSFVFTFNWFGVLFKFSYLS